MTKTAGLFRVVLQVPDTLRRGSHRSLNQIMLSNATVEGVRTYASCETTGNLVVKSNMPPQSGSSLEAVEPHP